MKMRLPRTPEIIINKIPATIIPLMKLKIAPPTNKITTGHNNQLSILSANPKIRFITGKKMIIPRIIKNHFILCASTLVAEVRLELTQKIGHEPIGLPLPYSAICKQCFC